MNYYLQVLKNYAKFDGRASRPEYWFFLLFNILAYIVLMILAKFVHVLALLTPIYALGVLVPSLAVCVRRLHDTGKPWFWIFIGLVPILGGLVLLFFMAQPSQSGSNQFGATPKA
jgi:uncharacterized membrane protein YhaH (DUF805 family)